jgi:hypothetical protein
LQRYKKDTKANQISERLRKLKLNPSIFFEC